MAITFSRNFAPQEGLTKGLQKPYREELCLNGYWRFAPKVLNSNRLTLEDRPQVVPQNLDWSEHWLKVPSPWNVNGFTDGKGGDFQNYPSYPKSWEGIKCGWLTKTVIVPESWKGNRVKLHFEAIAGCSRVFINGHNVKDNFDAFLPFTIDITGYAKPGTEVEIVVWVAHGSLFDNPGKYGYREHVSGSFWGTHIAGIWQDVYLQKVPEVHIDDVFVKPLVSQSRLDIEVTVTNETDVLKSVLLDGSINEWINETSKGILDTPEVKWRLGETLLRTGEMSLEIKPHTRITKTISLDVMGELPLWQPDQPELLGLIVDIKGLDRYYLRFGWREFKIHGKQLYLNGDQIQIKGDSWHFMGVPQMTRRYAYGWYQMLKDVGANGVRLHAQVYPRFYLEMADEMGICVLDESAIWFSDAGPRVDSEGYWDAARDHVKRMVLRDRNYPSVFGWSVCNETLEVTHRVYHAPHKYLRRNVHEINGWNQMAKDLDGSRDWISGDGELLPNTKLPTRIIHYADESIFQWLFHILRKPWGVGETGRCYYGTPKQVSKFNGDRAYESQLGRMEGLAAEAFDLIKRQRHFKAAYTSVFNLIWYGLKPLPLGLSDKGRPPLHEDGIFFDEFVEGQVGYQPERLGPYCTTLNPGYLPNKPLYDPWPLFDGVKAAYSEEYKHKENRWKKKKDTSVKGQVILPVDGVCIISEDKNGLLQQQLEHVGLVFETFDGSRPQAIILDGKHLPMGEQIQALKKAMSAGSKLLVWCADNTVEPFVSALTGEDMAIAQSPSSSYLIEAHHPVLNDTSHATWYLSELSEDYTSQITFGGQWVDESETLLKVSQADWRRWNYQSEATKTAQVYRSEHEAQVPEAVMVRRAYGKGELIVSSIDLLKVTGAIDQLVRPMFRNLGVANLNSAQHMIRAIDGRGRVRRVKASDGTQIKSDLLGTFDLNAYSDKEALSFCLYSPRSLTDLLIEPGIPRLDLELRGSLACDVYINDVKVDGFSYKGSKKILSLRGVPFEKGWNKIVLKTSKGQVEGSKISFRFTSNKAKFLKEIKAVVDRLFNE